MARNLFSAYGRVQTPVGNGKAFYVVGASNTLQPDLAERYQVDEDGVVRVFATIAEAISAAVASRGDYIYVMPGTYTLTTALAMSKADVHLVALGSPGTCVLTGSGADVMDLTGDGCEVAGFQINIASTRMGIDMVGADGCDTHDNVFLSAVGGAASHFINMNTTACNYNKIHDNRFISNLVVSGGAITQTSQITGLGIGNVIEHNVFVAGRVTTANAGAVTNGVVFANANDMGNVVRWNSFTEANGATFTNGLNYGTTAVEGAVLNFENNFFLATAANAVVNGANSAGFGSNIANGTV